jgi:hypothetical protein
LPRRGVQGFKVQRFKVQRFRVQGSEVQGSEVQRFRGSKVQVQRFRGSKRFRGSEVQRFKRFKLQFSVQRSVFRKHFTAVCVHLCYIQIVEPTGAIFYPKTFV